LFSQRNQCVEIALGQFAAVALPSKGTLIHRQRLAYRRTQFSSEVFRIDFSAFQLSEKSELRVGVQFFVGIFQTDLLKAPDCLWLINGDYHAAKIKNDVLYSAHTSSVVKNV